MDSKGSGCAGRCWKIFLAPFSRFHRFIRALAVLPRQCRPQEQARAGERQTPSQGWFRGFSALADRMLARAPEQHIWARYYDRRYVQPPTLDMRRNEYIYIMRLKHAIIKAALISYSFKLAPGQ